MVSLLRGDPALDQPIPDGDRQRPEIVVKSGGVLVFGKRIFAVGKEGTFYPILGHIFMYTYPAGIGLIIQFPLRSTSRGACRRRTIA